MQRILVWDYPQRLGHWLMAASFALAYASGEQEGWEAVHLAAGYCFAALLAFRVLWGLLGSRYARFAEFVRAPHAVFTYLRATLRGQAPHATGHNPAGGYAIVAMLGLGALLVAAGYAAWQEWGGEWVAHLSGELHEGVAAVLLALVGVHVCGVLAASFMHRENLVAAMFTGRKLGAAGSGLASARPAAGLLLLMLAAVAIALGWRA